MNIKFAASEHQFKAFFVRMWFKSIFYSAYKPIFDRNIIFQSYLPDSIKSMVFWWSDSMNFGKCSLDLFHGELCILSFFIEIFKQNGFVIVNDLYKRFEKEKHTIFCYKKGQNRKPISFWQFLDANYDNVFALFFVSHQINFESFTASGIFFFSVLCRKGWK